MDKNIKTSYLKNDEKETTPKAYNMQTHNDADTNKIVTKHGFTTTKCRSNTMKKIKGHNTVIETSFRLIFWHKGFRYRVNDRRLPGKPDIAFPRHKLAVFIDGEFWHGFNWDIKKHKVKSNRDYWIKKIEGNMQRDKDVNNRLTQDGWTVLRFWENEIKLDLDKCVSIVLNYLTK